MRLNRILICGLLALSLALPVSLADEVQESTPEPAPATEAPKPTEKPTEVPTEEPTEKPTEAPTEKPTEAPTEAPTEVPTEAPTEAPTEVPTEAPTEIPTEAPTEAPTEVPTVAPTAVITAEPTVEITAEPTAEITAEPTVEITAEPTAEITAEPTAEITAEPTAEITAEPTAEITVEPTAEVTAEPTAEATAEPTAEPTVTPEITVEPTITPEITPDPSATIDPSASPEVSPSPSPTVVPLPGEIGTLLTITPEGDAKQKDGVWSLSLKDPTAPIAFNWILAEGSTAQRYIVYVNADLIAADAIEARIELSAMNYAQGTHSLYVGAVLQDESITWGRADFTLAAGMGGKFPGKFPSGFGSFGGKWPSGGAAMGAAEADMGFRVTPGQAITGKHSSGNMDQTPYTDAGVKTLEEATTCLTLNLTQAEITLDDGSSPFHVTRSDGEVELVPAESGSAWNLSALAMNALHESGVERVSFHLDGMVFSLPTRMEFTGSIYGKLRAQGYVAKDVLLRISDTGVIAAIASEEYRINEGGELVPLEG